MSFAMNSITGILKNYDFQKAFVNIATYGSYVPRLSQALGLLGILQKGILFRFLKPETITKNRYFTHIQQQPYLRFAVQLHKYGCILVSLYDLYQNAQGNDRKKALEWVKVNGLDLQNVSSRLKNDKEIVLEAIRQNYKATAMVGTTLKLDKQFWVEACNINLNVIEFLPTAFEADPAFTTKKINPHAMNPHQIVKYLDTKVVGQKRAKQTVAASVFRHYQMIKSTDSTVNQFKSNVIIFGPSGSGKTHTIESAAKLFNVPFYAADATKYTSTGNVGLSVEDMLASLYERSGKDIERTQRGIIFIDEIDKLRKTDNSFNDFRTISVQQSLLKIIEGTKTVINANESQARLGLTSKLEIDSRNILFFAGGAFVDLENIVKARLIKDNLLQASPTKDELLSKADARDFIAYGMIPELVGRFSSFTAIKELTEDELKQIVCSKEDSIINYYQKLFKAKNITLVFDEGAIGAIIYKARQAGTGARGLPTIANQVCEPLMCEDFFSSGKKATVTINNKTVLKGDDPVIVYDDEEEKKSTTGLEHVTV